MGDRTPTDGGRRDLGGRHARQRRWRWVRPMLRVAGVLATICLVAVSVSVVGALRAPGNDSFKAKWADWLREHRAASVVNFMEEAYFRSQAPKTGGVPEAGVRKVRPPAALPAAATVPVTTGPVPTTTTLPPHLATPPPVRLVTQSIPEEGQWQATGPLVQGLPGLYVTQVRPDDVHTSVLVSLAWIDTRLLRLNLMPGTQEPGPAFQTRSDASGDTLPKLVAAFNGGFRFKDGAGGFYLEGKEAVPLVDGKASVVIYKDGRVDIGQWDRDLHLDDSVESVRQNLVLLVDGGKVVEGIDPNDNSIWGNTLNGTVYVPRSGMCVDANGAVIYVGGPGMNITTLADTMARAGCVRGLELDINPEWVTFNIFDHPNPDEPSQVEGRKLYDGMYKPASRYLEPESRDFFKISLR